MISTDSFNKTWITSQKVARAEHYETIEKVIHAFYLLELLTQQKFDFVFKGGSSLLLHFQDLHRFSVDIDIMINPDNFEKLLRFIDEFSNERFFTVVEDKRKPSILKKAHYKFFYNSVLQLDPHRRPYILLDIVVDHIPFLELTEKTLDLVLLNSVVPMVKVKIPSIEEMLGDKLTAFAPETIGILYIDQKYTEIIKQLYDCSRLFQASQNYDIIIQTYLKISAREIKYRGLKKKSISDCLQDTLNTCKLLLSNGKTGDAGHFELLKRGVIGFSNFVIESFNINDGMLCALDVYICCVVIMAGNMDAYRARLIGFNVETVKAPFLNRGNIKMLKLLSKTKYIEFLEAVWVENSIMDNNVTTKLRQ